jgi:capsular polysaccharide biosynthesis protein
LLRSIVLRLVETYFRHRWLWLVPILLMCIFAGARFFISKPSYISLAAVYVNKQSLLASLTSIREDGFSWVTPAQAAVDEFKELIQTDAFIRSVVQKTSLEESMATSPQNVARTLVEVRSSVWADVLGKNTIVIGAKHEQPEIAKQLAAGVIEVYTQWKINTGREETAAALLFFDDLVKDYQSEVDNAEAELQAYLEKYPAPVRGERPPSEQVALDRLNKNLTDTMVRLNDTQNSLRTAQLNAAVNESNIRQTYLLIDAPNIPIEPTKSKKSLLIDSAVFIILGLMISVVGIVIGALLDQSIRFPQDTQQWLELPLIACLKDPLTPAIVVEKSNAIEQQPIEPDPAQPDVEAEPQSNQEPEKARTYVEP